MLTADLVRATRRGTQLHVSALTGKQRVRALELAETYLGLAVAQCGVAHHELKAAWAAIEVLPREVKLTAGLLKLIEDACEFESESEIEPRQLRSDVFSRAAAQRRSLGEEQRFERASVLSAVAEPRGIAPEQVERALYSDLKSEHRLLRAPELSPEQLLQRYELAQVQAVLLRAVKVTARVHCATPDGYRQLFRKLKFRRLLFQIRPEEAGSYLLEIDGPFSLFESVTKYGLQLALMLPTLLCADRLELEADLRWGKAKSPLKFCLEQKGGRGEKDDRARLPDEVETLLAAFAEPREGWSAEPAERVLSLPGVGLCVPDLRFSHRGGAIIFLEVLGYWSRDAVWQRVELVQKGLGEKLLFAASQRLRVSEEVLEDHPSGALYVYKGTLSARAIVDRLERLRLAQ
jgi:predicted nuclease of restriction endonuclease-like RecB superfamily